MRISAHVQYDTSNIELFRSANIWRLNLHRKYNTKCETVAKIQDMQVIKL
jgi:hypothetical protein